MVQKPNSPLATLLIKISGDCRHRKSRAVFNQLSGLGLQFERKAFADHHAFTKQDLMQFSGKTILMTEKDAVKCATFTTSDAWCLPVAATISAPSQTSLITLILQKLRT